MRKILTLIFGFCIFISQVSNAQIYNYPKCNSKNEKDLTITKVTINDYSAKIDFELVNGDSKAHYIFLSPPNSDGAYFIRIDGKIYKLMITMGIGEKDGITVAYPNKANYFSATFEAIPKNTTQFDLIEGSSGTWNFYGVQLQNSNFESSNYSSKPKTCNNLNDWRGYFTENISKVDNVEGIYKSSWNSIKYYEGKMLFNNPDNSGWDLIMPYVVIIKNNNEYKRYAVSNTSSSEYDIFLKTYSESKFVLKVEKPTYTYFDSPEIYYSNAEFNIQYTKDYKTILDEYIKLNNDNGGQLDNLTLKSMASKTKRIVEQNMVKIFPTMEMINNERTNKEVASKPIIVSSSITGTGFAIASNGYIITCNHVIDGAKSIKIKGVNGNFSKEYKATLISSDKNNDIALLKIDDASFTNFGTIPYTIKSTTSDVGSNIFILGYPLTATMGDEIKLTDGIISAKSGFSGDITSYQISAAAQAGNSGGPLFDKNGNIIGVVNAKHIQAENATYAVKSSYLLNLIESLSTTPKLSTFNILNGKQLTEQVKLIKNFVFIIEVSSN